MSGDSFWLSQLGGGGGGEKGLSVASNGQKVLILLKSYHHKSVFTLKIYLVQNVNSAEAEKHWHMPTF